MDNKEIKIMKRVIGFMMVLAVVLSSGSYAYSGAKVQKAIPWEKKPTNDVSFSQFQNPTMIEIHDYGLSGRDFNLNSAVIQEQFKIRMQRRYYIPLDVKLPVKPIIKNGKEVLKLC